VLVHCFADCDVHAILSAASLEMSTLFPPSFVGQGSPERRPFPAADVLRCVAFEALVVAAAGASILSGHPFTAIDRARLILAVCRIEEALTAAGVNRG